MNAIAAGGKVRPSVALCAEHVKESDVQGGRCVVPHAEGVQLPLEPVKRENVEHPRHCMSRRPVQWRLVRWLQCARRCWHRSRRRGGTATDPANTGALATIRWQFTIEDLREWV